jgi:hypothetical protein
VRGLHSGTGRSGILLPGILKSSMYSLFALLLRKSYWQMLLRQATWYEAWLNLKRVHKDRRARKHIRHFLFLLIIPVLCLAYLVWVARSGAVFIVPILAAGVWWTNRRRRQEGGPLTILPGKAPAFRELSEAEQREVRAYFAELALLYAVMLDRAGSEAFLKEKVLPEGFEVTSRRVHLDMLKSNGLWDKMHPDDRESMMMADGHWEWERINYYTPGLEPLRLLRWILRLDFYLPVVGNQLKFDWKIANELVRAPQKLLGGKELGTLKMIDIGRKSAEQFFLRCLAEEITRGYREAEDKEWAEKVNASMAGKQHEDFVLAGKLVSEADKDQLIWATQLSRRRMLFLNFAGVTMDRATAPETPYTFLP